mgnify:CR=1 FL=1
MEQVFVSIPIPYFTLRQTDGHGASVFANEGLGKTSGVRTVAAFGGCVAPGSTLVHDTENGHNRLVRELGLRSERSNSKLIKRLPDSENPLAAAAVPRLALGLRPRDA